MIDWFVDWIKVTNGGISEVQYFPVHRWIQQPGTTAFSVPLTLVLLI